MREFKKGDWVTIQRIVDSGTSETDEEYRKLIGLSFKIKKVIRNNEEKFPYQTEVGKFKGLVYPDRKGNNELDFCAKELKLATKKEIETNDKRIEQAKVEASI